MPPVLGVEEDGLPTAIPLFFPVLEHIDEAAGARGIRTNVAAADTRLGAYIQSTAAAVCRYANHDVVFETKPKCSCRRFDTTFVWFHCNNFQAHIFHCLACLAQYLGRRLIQNQRLNIFDLLIPAKIGSTHLSTRHNAVPKPPDAPITAMLAERKGLRRDMEKEQPAHPCAGPTFNAAGSRCQSRESRRCSHRRRRL